jgi:hypothetical protein
LRDRRLRFSAMAREVSDCDTAREGGVLGDLQLVELEEEFEPAVCTLGVWELSEFVQTDSGAHIIMRLPPRYAMITPNILSPPNLVPTTRNARGFCRIGGRIPSLPLPASPLKSESGKSILKSPTDPSSDLPVKSVKYLSHRAPGVSTKKESAKHAAPALGSVDTPESLRSFSFRTVSKHKGSTVRQQEEARMRRLFDQADTDGGGTLQLKEVKALCKSLGERTSSMVLEEGFYRMDPEKTGKVDYESFKK